MQKEISIIVPCYNVEKYIEKCFKSIDYQLKKEYEVFFINDGSTDNTGEILEKLKVESSNQNRINIIHQENKGLSETRNIGIELANGKYISFIDGDDWVSENYFLLLLSSIDNCELCVTSYNRVLLNSIEERILGWNGRYNQKDWKRRLLGLINEELIDPSQADTIVTAWGKLFKSSILINHNIKFVDTKIIGTEDLLFNLEYAQFVDNVIIVDQPLYQYRKDNMTSLTKTYKPDFFSKWDKKYQLILERISITLIEEKQAFQNRIALSIIGLGLNELGNPKGLKEITKNLKFILEKDNYKEAFQNLEMKYFPIHWKIFFWAAKNKQVYLLYFLLLGVSYMIQRNNK